MRGTALLAILVLTGLARPMTAQVITDVTECLAVQGIQGCAPVGDPYIENTCVAGVERYLARAVSMEELAMLNFPGTCWGAPPGSSSAPNCAPPYTYCWTSYCPGLYCANLSMLADIGATFVVRAATFRGREKEILPGKWYRDAAEQLVRDVNATYDCAGLRRPIIQGSIFEDVLPGVEEVLIPSPVISAFADEIDPARRSDYLHVFTDGQGHVVYSYPRTDVHYQRSRINFPGEDHPDIRQVEARMWFYHQARVFIDAGYRALHMGQIGIWGRQDAGYVRTYSLLNKIRDYAKSRGTFVIMNPEMPRGQYALKYAGTERLLFDFDGRTARPREIVAGMVAGENGCADPYDLDMLDDTACRDEPYNAFVDRCVVESFGREASGLSPMGCRYEQVPYFVYWDFGPGWYVDQGLPVNMAHPGNNNGTWGWDDTRWFATQISPECRTDWFEKFYCDVRDFHNGHGFLQAPGIINVPYPENYNEAPGDDLSPIASGRFMLVDEPDDDGNGVPDFQESIRALWAVGTPEIGRSLRSRCDVPAGRCRGTGRLGQSYRPTYRLYVRNPDCSSVYTWHIRRPDGSWEPMTRGRERLFTPSREGRHTVYLRWDNLGLDPATFGSRTLSTPLDVEFCCLDLWPTIFKGAAVP